MTYHRPLEANEKVVQIPLGNNKEANLLFTQPQETETWVCISTAETQDDLQRLLNGENLQ